MPNRSREIIHPLGGFEIAVLTWPAKTDNSPVQMGFEGWLWFYIATAQFQLNNVGGVAAANAQMVVTYGNAQVINAVCAFAVAGGATQQAFFGVQLPNANIAGIVSYAALPLVICPNAAALTIQFVGGDAGTRVSNGSMTIHGQKFYNKARED